VILVEDGRYGTEGANRACLLSEDETAIEALPDPDPGYAPRSA
jgi:hypothetical protein